MESREVKGTAKEDGTQEILGLCNYDEDWKSVTSDEAIVHIDNGEFSYYVGTEPNRTGVVVIKVGSRSYLRTEADDSTSNNLAQLPDC